MSAARVGQIVRRIPLIKFRYVKSLNGFPKQGSHFDFPEVVKSRGMLKNGMSPAQPIIASSYNGVSNSSTTPRPSSSSKEFYQLPKKYRASTYQ
ncbi:uncharacterized protein [Amphiura filiformis]|uniref:uncharacterized protein isoform X2 n=1 Tax=Amphiura filiformis TaxID=82378 RepID=UPI003B223368